MITISGRQLISSEFVNVNPIDNPVRTIFFLLPVLIFTYYSFQLLHHLERGVTLALPKRGFPWLKIFPGKVKIQAKYHLQHFDNPYLTGLLGLIFFAAAEFFLVIMFKLPVYTFL